MRVLVCGADGFLGRHVMLALARRGHQMVRGVHRPKQAGDLVLDYRLDLVPEAWLHRLADIDAVVNAVGILHERQPGDFERVHHRAPEALFQACARAGIRRVVQISALGDAGTPYLASKRAADQALWRLLPEGVVLRPGLVFGRDGASTRFFLALASLPLHGRPQGAGPVQPVHVDDVAEIVARLVEGAPVPARLLDAPGPERLAYGAWLDTYRAGLGLAPALGLSVPASVMTATAWLAGHLPASLLSPSTWAMLRAGNTGDPAPATGLLGRPLTTPGDFIADEEREGLRQRALAAWHRPLARWVLAAIWLGSALVSAGLFPIEGSLDRLAPYGLEGLSALAVLAVASMLDLAIGLLTLFRPSRRLWLAQLVIVLGYTLLVGWRLPDFLVDPFGPILKNLAVAALLVQLWSGEKNP